MWRGSMAMPCWPMVKVICSMILARAASMPSTDRTSRMWLVQLCAPSTPATPSTAARLLPSTTSLYLQVQGRCLGACYPPPGSGQLAVQSAGRVHQQSRRTDCVKLMSEAEEGFLCRTKGARACSVMTAMLIVELIAGYIFWPECSGQASNVSIHLFFEMCITTA